MKILFTLLVLALPVFLTACSSNPLPNPLAVAQLGQLTTKPNMNTAGTNTAIGIRNSASFGQIQTASHKIGKAISSATSRPLDPNSPEALERDEKIGRGELPEEFESTNHNKENALHAATLENCPHKQATTGVTFSTIPMGISECEMLSLRGIPSSVRKLSLPNETRRVLLSFKSKDGEMLYEFVDNKLTTIY